MSYEFKHNYKYTIIKELPSNGMEIKYFKSGTSINGKDGIIVKVSPKGKKSWIGIFAFGQFKKDNDGVYYTPNKNTICVVSGGIGYMVNTLDISYEIIKAIGIEHLHPSTKYGLIIFGNRTNLYAYDKRGFKWKTPRIAWDGFIVNEVKNEKLIGKAETIDGRSCKDIEVDILLGKINKAGYP